MERMPKITKEKRTWFEIPDDPIGGAVELRHVKDGEIQKLMTGITETERSYSGGQVAMKVRQTSNPSIELAVASIVAWKNHQDENGEDLDCTDDNVRLFLNEDGYLNFISASIEKLSKLVEEDRKSSEKN